MTQGEAGEALTVQGLRIVFGSAPPYVVGVENFNLRVRPGEFVALVGESGSGKSVLLQALVGISRGHPGVVAGAVDLNVGGRRLALYPGIETGVRLDRNGRYRVASAWRRRLQKRFRSIRGRHVGLVLQNGVAALNPFKRIRWQLEAAGPKRSEGRLEKARALLRETGFRDPEKVLQAYPHELSGGMAQRAMIAIVLALEPDLLLLDEVTTGLDVSLQAELASMLRRHHERSGHTGILVTHDIGIAERLAHRILVMRAGQVVEELAQSDKVPTQDEARETYTLDLFRAAEWKDEAVEAPPPAEGPSVIRLSGVQKRYDRALWPWARSRSTAVAAVADADLEVQRGECVALVGESGSGKTTLARLILGLVPPTQGRIVVLGEDLQSLGRREEQTFRQRTQILFQNPYTSLNPEMNVVEALVEGLRAHAALDRPAARAEAEARLRASGLGHRFDTVIGTLSGGERRRVGVLRALSCGGDLVVLDEPSTGLDAVHRTLLGDMIQKARAEAPARTFVFISHDLGFVTRVAERVLVMFRGRIVEACSASSLLDPTAVHHPYTEALLLAAKYVRMGSNIGEFETSIADVGSSPERGCTYAPRCGLLRRLEESKPRCWEEMPVLLGRPEGRIACHEKQPG